VNGYFGTRINDTLLSSTTWVHKADVDGDGQVSQSDFILFKLQQMQKLDYQMLDRLIDRYHELDIDGNGYLTVGDEIPSGSQVEIMGQIKDQLKIKASSVEMWMGIIKESAQLKPKDAWFQMFMGWPREKLSSREKHELRFQEKRATERIEQMEKPTKEEFKSEKAEAKYKAQEQKYVLQAQKENEMLQKMKDKKDSKENLAFEKLRLKKEQERVKYETQRQKQSQVRVALPAEAEKPPPKKKLAPLDPQRRLMKSAEHSAIAVAAKVSKYTTSHELS
jgi:hypothetical protein